MSENNSGSRGGPEGSSPYGDQSQPSHGQNLPQYGQNLPQYGEQGQAPYGQQSPSPYGQQGQYGSDAGNYPGQQGYPGQPAENPGRTLGIVGFILAIFVAPVGVIVSIVALVKSRKAKMGNGFALAGIIVGIVITIIGGILLFALIAFFGEVAQQVIEACEGVPAGTPVTIEGQTIECPAQ